MVPVASEQLAEKSLPLLPSYASAPTSVECPTCTAAGVASPGARKRERMPPSE